MSVISQGIKKQTIIKKQTALGSLASGAGGQILRRRTSIFELTKASYESDELVSHQQSTGMRHGMGTVKGAHKGLLSPGTFKLLLAASCRADFVAGSTTGALTNVTAQVAGPQFTRAAGSFLTDGFKQYDVIRWTGWLTTGVNNNSRNFWITALTATQMTGVFLDGTAAGAKAAGDSVTATVVGKKTKVPLTGHTDDLFTVEQWAPDITSSAVYGDNKVDTTAIGLPASGNATIDVNFMGLSESLTGAQVLTTPTVETTTEILAAVHGALQINGAAQSIVTGLTINIAENTAVVGPVVGSNAGPDVSRGKVKVSGQFTAYFTDTTLMALLTTESNIAIAVVATCDSTATSDFIALNMTRCKIATNTPDDGEKGIMRTYNFVAEIDINGSPTAANDETILTIQDSAA